MTADSREDGRYLPVADAGDVTGSSDRTGYESGTAGAMANDLALAQNIIDTAREPMLVLDDDLRVMSANRSFYREFHVEPEATVGRLIYELGNGQWDIPLLRDLLEDVLPSNHVFNDYEVEHDFEGIGRRVMLLNGRKILDEHLILLAIQDNTERKRLEQALIRAKEQAEKTINTVREPMLILDNDLCVLSANDAFYADFRVAPAETEGKHVYDLGDGQWDIPRLRQLLDGVLPDDNRFNDYRVEHEFPGIGRRRMLLNARRIDHVQLILLAIEDVTDREQFKHELESERARLEAILNTLPVGLVIADEEGRIIGDNEAAREIWGGPLKAESWADYEKFVGWFGETGERIKPHEWAMTRALRSGEETRNELILAKKLNSEERTYYLNNVSPIRDGEGRITGAVRAMVDVTDRLAMEGALRESEEQLQAIVEQIPVGVGVLDRDGRWLMRNSMMMEFIRGNGLPSRDLQEASHWQTWDAHGNPIERMDWPGARALRGESVSQGMDFLHTADDGTQRWLRVTAAPFKEEGDEITGAIVVVQDVTQRRQVVAALQESEERYRTLFDSMDEGFCILEMIYDDNDEVVDGRFVATNPAYARQTDRRDFVGHTLLETIPNYPIERLRMFGEIGKSETPVRHTTLLGLQSGRWFETHAFRTGDPEERRVAVLMSEITERKTTEDALRESEERYRTLFAAMDEAYAVVEVMRGADGRWADFRFLDVNPAFVQHTGMEYPVGRTATELLGTPNPRWSEIYGQVAETGEPVRFEEREAVLDRIFDLYAFRLGGPGSHRVAVLFTNVTERRRAEAALRESEAELSRLADSMPDLIWSALPDGEVDWYNRQLQRYGGMQRNAADRWDWASIVHEDDKQATRDAWTTSIRDGTPYEVEHRLSMADGSYRWHISRGDPVCNAEGEVIRWYGAATDIHAQKIAEFNLLQKEADLREALAVKDDFLALVSHELRTPLTTITGFARHLARTGDGMDAESRRAAIEQLHNDAIRLQTLIENLLILTQMERTPPELEPMLLQRLIPEALMGYTDRHPGRRVLLDVPSDLPVATGQPSWVSQVVQNLVSNADKYSPKGEPVEVTAGAIDGRVQVQVADRGQGVPEEEESQLFEPFFRSKTTATVSSGAGIGLTVCKRLLESQGGEIRYRRREGGGSIFEFTLPVTEE